MSSNLRMIRHRLGMTQTDLGTLFGVSKSMVSQYEAGSTDLPARMARELIHHAAAKGERVTFDDIYAGPKVSPGETAPSAEAA